MTEYGKHGKPRSRLSTLPTLRGHPFGITTFPRPRLLAYFKMQEHERPNPRPLDLKGVVMEALGPKCIERSGTLRFDWRCCTPRLPAAAVAFHPPAPIGLFLASMPFRDLGYPAHESVMTSRLLDPNFRVARLSRQTLGISGAKRRHLHAVVTPVLTQAMPRWARARSCLSRLPSRANRALVLPRQEAIAARLAA
jgi:hypothetical protein